MKKIPLFLVFLSISFFAFSQEMEKDWYYYSSVCLNPGASEQSRMFLVHAYQDSVSGDQVFRRTASAVVSYKNFLAYKNKYWYKLEALRGEPVVIGTGDKPFLYIE